MKKAMILMTALVLMGIGLQAKTFERCYQPGTNNVASVINNFADEAVPVLIYTDLTGTTTNTVTMAFIASTATDSVDYGKVYPVGSFSTVGGSEVPIVLNTPGNTNSAGNVVLKRNAELRLTGAGGTASTNVFYRILFEVP